jgi:outer membrane protein OmpA-like peptidoglycan-associated protein
VLISLLLTVLAAEPPPRPEGVAPDSCFGAGVWTPSGEHGPLPDDCNTGLCSDGRWSSTTLLSCELQLNEVISFLPHAHRLEPQQATIFVEIARLLTEHGELRLTIHGHTSPAEQRRSAGLGALRAQAVRDALVTAGVEPGCLVVLDQADTKPLVVGEDVGNCRVDFELSER